MESRIVQVRSILNNLVNQNGGRLGIREKGGSGTCLAINLSRDPFMARSRSFRVIRINRF
jgi:hypothetical protein